MKWYLHLRTKTLPIHTVLYLRLHIIYISSYFWQTFNILIQHFLIIKKTPLALYYIEFYIIKMIHSVSWMFNYCHNFNNYFIVISYYLAAEYPEKDILKKILLWRILLIFWKGYYCEGQYFFHSVSITHSLPSISRVYFFYFFYEILGLTVMLYNAVKDQLRSIAAINAC